MSERIHALAQILLGKTSLEECSVEEIRHLTKRFPYFAPAQFLLLQKLKETGSPEAEKQNQKTILYFPDPLQFESFVSSEKFLFDEPAFDVHRPAFAAELSKGTDAPLPGSLQTEEESLLQQEAMAGSADEEISSAPLTEPALELETAGEAEPETTAEPENFFVEQLDKSEQETIPTRQEETKEEAAAILAPTEEEPELTAAEQTPSYEEERTTSEERSEITTANEEAKTTAQGEDKPDLPTHTSAAKETSLPVEQPSANDSLLTFEPFHTVDYFASQGIKISAEELPKDRLGKQLRSFTEWLKIMKRLPATEMAKTPQSSAEKSVENLASHSVEESDVITEAMAEVWTKQGNRQKAIETYNKLSLLNPSKKAYFAAKIENLKES